MRSLFLACLAVALAALAGAQSATAKLYTKAEGGKVLVAIQVTPDPGAWVYHDEADSGGKPTVVTLGPDNLTWSKPAFPAPTIKDDPIVGKAKVHKHKFYIYAVGEGEGVEPADVTVQLDGLACNDRMCLPWSVPSIPNRGAGAEAVWAEFPAALLAGSAPAAAISEPPPASQPAAAPTEGSADTWKPNFTGGDRVVSRAFARVEGETVTVAVELAIAPKFHIYHGPAQSDVGPGVGLPTTPSIEGGNVDWGDWVFPTPHEYDDGFTDITYVHEGRAVLRVTGEAYGAFDPESVEIKIDGQTCDDKGCMVFAVAPALGEGAGPDALFAAAAATATEHSGAGAADAGTTDAVALTAVEGGPPAQKESKSLLQFLLLAMGAGFITLLMPCTYPMIPITISFFTKQATARNGNVLSLALLYGFGIVAIFVLIGALIGPIIVEVAQGWPMNLAIGILFVVFALSLFGMINLQPPAFLMNAAGKASQRGGYFGVFLMGACLVITSFTCTAPFVGSLLGAGAGSSLLRIVLGMGVFGLTMATPFVFLALVPGKLQKLPQAGGWMETLKVFMGFVELAAAMKFFSNADIVLSGSEFIEGNGLISRELFLATWSGIALVAAMYLFGRINLKGESPDGHIGPGRLMGGLGSVLFALYCWLGVQGYQLGGVMSALAPPTHYTAGLVPTFQGSGGGAPAQAHTVIKDDYDAAVSTAKREGKVLLANFTGHT
ncbi:MAG: protein-disulfide reductase DsbD family protein [Planctomycetota bacterium]